MACTRSAIGRFYSKSTAQVALRHLGISSSKSLFDDDGPVDLTENIDYSRKPSSPQNRPPRLPTPLKDARHRVTIKKDFPDGWNPPKKLSRESMDGIRSLYALDKETFSTPVLAEKFRVSPEAIRRILKSKWQPSPERQMEIARKERKFVDDRILVQRELERQEQQAIVDAQKGVKFGGTFGFGHE